MTEPGHKLRRIGLTAILIGLTAVLVLSLYLLPAYVEKRLLPRFAAAAGLEAINLRVRHIGWRRADLGPIVLTRDRSPFLSIDAVQIDYSPWSLLQRKIDGIVLIGLNLEWSATEQVSALSPADHTDERRPLADPAQGWPLTPKHFAVRHAVVTLRRGNQAVRLPLALDLNITLRADERIESRGGIALGGNPLQVAALLDPRAHSLELTLAGEQLQAEPIAAIFAANAPRPFSGLLDIAASARFRLSPFAIESFSTESLLSRARIDLGGTVLETGNDDAAPVAIRVSTDDARQWRWSVGPIQMIAPLALQVPLVEGSLTIGRTAEGTLTARLDMGLNDLRLRRPQGELHSPRITLAADLAVSPDLQIDALMNFPATFSDDHNTTIELPQSKIEARLRRSADGRWSANGAWVSSGGQIRHAAHDVRLTGLHTDLPLKWPVPAEGVTGRLGIHRIFWKSKDAGGVSGALKLLPSGLQADMRHSSKLLPGMQVHIQSTVDPSGAAVTVVVPAYQPAAPLDLARFFPAADGFTAAGRLQARVAWTMSAAAAHGTARIQLDQGAVRHVQRQVALEGISCDLRLDDLRQLRSAPAQHLEVAHLQWGKLTADDLALDFQLEPGATLFIEKAGVRWCRGTLQTQSLRLYPGRDALDATLYCDRLNLAMVLHQLGAARGDGEGAVNGRVPLRWHKGELIFDNGFLYSTPGQSGTIQLEAADWLTGALPPGSPQRTELDIATEALKDYSYQWAKMTLTSKDRILRVRLQLDGKPNRPLPFAYDTQSGVLKRIEGRGQAEFEGIAIDLNFQTPLREMLRYKELLTPKTKSPG